MMCLDCEEAREQRGSRATCDAHNDDGYYEEEYYESVEMEGE